MDVAAWLRGLGLEQYAQLFRDNEQAGMVSESPEPLAGRLGAPAQRRHCV